MYFIDEKPVLSELRTIVVPIASFKWEDVGIALGLADDEEDDCYLEDLAKKHEDNTKRLTEVFKKWLRDSKVKDHVKRPTWRHLLNVLKDLGINDAVLKVQERKGENNVIIN